MCGQVPFKGSRKHGLQTPLQPYQILVWLTIGSSILLFFFLCVPFFANDTQRGIFTGLYLLLMVVGFTAFFIVSLTDPALKNGSLPAGEGVYAKQCTTCGSTMTPSTKHCYHCHKCVEGFDHHCLYLNTCVGKYNYTSFFILISCLSSLVLLQSCVTALLLATYDTAEVAAHTHWTVLNPRGYMILLAATAFIPVGGFLLILSLLGFHAWIICWGITTYNWILDRRQKNQLKQDARAEKKAQKLSTAEQKALIKKGGDKTPADLTATTTGSASTTYTLSARPTPSPVDSHPPSVSAFPFQADSLLANKITPSTTQPTTTTPQTIITSDKQTPLSIHTPSPPVVLHVKPVSPSGPPPALVEMTSSGVGVPQTSISFGPGTGDLDPVEGYGSAYDVNDENNPLMDPRASVSVERPLSVLGIDLGEKPFTRRPSRHDSSARLSV